MRLFKRFLIIFLGFLVLVGLGGYMWLNPGRGPRVQVDPEANGWVETVDGALVLHLKGTPYEMGYQRGYFAKEKVQLMMDLFNGLLKQAEDEVRLPRFASNLILDITYQLCAPYIPERYKREMEGLADGSGCDLKIIRRGHVLSVLTERGCSAFAVWGHATADGTLFHGRNFDWITSAGLEDSAVLALYEPEGLKPFAAVGYAGVIGVYSGMNMDGISISQIGAITEDKSLRGLPLEFVLRRLLEECGDMDDVRHIMNSVKHTVGFNYVVADGDARTARAFETTAHHVAEFGPNDPKETVEYAVPIEDAVFRSDEAMDPVVRSLQKCANAPGLPYGSNSYDHRYMGIVKGIKEHYGKIDQPTALEILKSTAMENANLHSVLANSTTRELWVANASKGQNASLQPYIHFDLKRLFLRPEHRPPVETPAAEPSTEPAAESSATDKATEASETTKREEQAEETGNSAS